MRGKWLFWVRRLHLYLSVFFAPLLLLFVITGWAQTTGFAHHATPTLLERLASVHKGDYFPAPGENFGTKGKAGPQPSPGNPRISGDRLAGQTGLRGERRITWPTKWLVVAMCIALLVSISLGLILAFTMVRNRIPVWIALILGVATPVLFLALAHAR